MINQPLIVSENKLSNSKKKLYFYLSFFGAVGIALSCFMGYCQIKHSQLAEIRYGTANILSFIDDKALPIKIMTYFDDNPMVTAFCIICAIAVILSMVIPSLSVRCNVRAEAPNSIFTVFASSLLGFLFAGYFVNFILIPLRPFWTTVKLPGPDFNVMTPMLKILFIAGILVSIPCAVYFLLIATQHRFTQNKNMCMLSVFPVIWLSLRLVFYFMSTSAHVNLAGRKLFILSLVFAIVFFVQDAKRWIPLKDGEGTSGDSKSSVLYLASGFASVVSFTVYHLSTTYLQAFWMLKPEDTYILNGIFISMILFIAFRLASVRICD